MRNLFEGIEIEKFSSDEIKILIQFITYISSMLCMNQYCGIDDMLQMACKRYKIPIRKDLFDIAISICQQTTIITDINNEGIAYQTLSLCKPIKSDEQLRTIVHHY